MGKVLCSLIEESENKAVAAFVSAEFETEKEKHIYQSIGVVTEKAECIIDFSHHSATE